MKAMILAAGMGSRLRPLTDNRPKALVEVSGRTLLEITLGRLKAFGIREVIINVHHFAEMIVDYLRANENFGMSIELSREEVLLDTGGGLKKAGWFFLNDSQRLDEPFLLHNVDVISDVDLQRMVQFHVERRALATLMAQDRETSRYLLFDEDLQLKGRLKRADEKAEYLQSSPQMHVLAFCGIHIISPRLLLSMPGKGLAKMTSDGAFSIIDAYLQFAGLGEKILAFRADEAEWHDLGTAESVLQATRQSKL